MDAPTHDNRCRLCTANDLDGLKEEMAEALWESRRRGTLDDWPWAEAGPMWQRVFRDFGETAVEAMLERHRVAIPNEA
jgi:hypothetical protein